MPALVPPEGVVDLAHEMAAADQTMREILEETLDSADTGGEMTESGRTACGEATNLREPFARWPESVELQSCPRGLIGVWHSHVTHDELLAPEHSLPDQANVAFGHVDVSIVVGAESAEVLVGAADREEMADSFRSVLGLEVRSTREVVDALETGLIQDPPAARQRVRTAWQQLVYREQTEFATLAQRVRELDREAVPARTVACHVHADQHDHAGDASDEEAAAAARRLDERGADADAGATAEPVRLHTTAPDRLRRQARAGGDFLRDLTGDLSIREEVVGSAAGIIVGRLVERALFGE